jgi:DNA-binding beta-propeller fold protein YncE
MNTKTKPLLIIFLFTGVFLFSGCHRENDLWIIQAPAGKEFTRIDPRGKTVLPNGRLITPAGKNIIIAPHPYGLTLSPDGNIIVTANSGVNPLSITIIRNVLSEHPDIQQIPPGPFTDKGVLASVFMGLAISPDNKTVYVAGGQTNKIYLFDLATGEKSGEIKCSTTDYPDGYIGDLILSKNGKTLYAVDQTGFRMIIVDMERKTVRHSVPVGRYPFGICLSPDEKKIYVANVGMFQYGLIKENKEDSAKIKPIDFPAFAYGSKEMINGINSDTISIPGLGDPNALEAFSVFTISLEDTAHPSVTARTKTGYLTGSLVEGIPAVGGSSPNSIVATNKYVFVSNGNNDNISVISTVKDTVVHTIYLKPDKRVRQFRGVIPFGLALSRDGKRLYVAESGINAVAVINVADFSVLGHLPTGWFPSRVQVSSDGRKLLVTNAKGYGSGPNGGAVFERRQESSYIGSLMKGTLQVADIPPDDQLEQLTAQVIANLRIFESDELSKKYLGLDKALGAIDENILNVNGGAVALGHPVGSSASRLVLTLLRELKRRGKETGLATLCVGGGQGAAFIVERM